ncbi:unnamed protein product [Diatraea saccharalis]|uniref:G-protein coupled receptors family 2 profile 2 domain-containing protein n=1 Tax=Diatraea saccharalis TaxID=40085 RepID=A0A9N9WE58_9NEOP|nr:unnamed protein product [Diatraea saccharalis]
MWKLLILSLYLGVSVAVTPKFCCEPGSAILKRRNVCWNPVSNVTNDIKTLECQFKLRLLRYEINSDGTLLLPLSSKNFTVDVKSYCLGNATTIKDLELKNATETALVCSDKKEKIIDDKVSGYCLIVSVVFLFLTAIVYAALSELRDLQGKSFVCFCISLGLGMMILVIMKLMTYSDMKLCAVRGFLTYFFFLASFFWTNAISIQILLCIRRPSTINYKWKDFFWYALYAWGCPALLTMILAIINFVPGNHSRPGIGLMHCWFYDKENQWYYMYSVMSILIIANICIFIYTSVCLWRNTFATSHLKALKYKFMMTLRLFVLMGVTWIFEMFSSFMEESHFWVIIDIYNTLQGLMIFLMLVPFRRRAVKAMYKQGWLDCCTNAVEKHLAVGEDDEQDVMAQNTDVPMEDRNGK